MLEFELKKVEENKTCVLCNGFPVAYILDSYAIVDGKFTQEPIKDNCHYY